MKKGSKQSKPGRDGQGDVKAALFSRSSRPRSASSQPKTMNLAELAKNYSSLTKDQRAKVDASLDKSGLLGKVMGLE